jgi:hypothetical protein
MHVSRSHGSNLKIRESIMDQARRVTVVNFVYYFFEKPIRCEADGKLGIETESITGQKG